MPKPWCHIMALELDMEAFMEVLEPLIEVAMTLELDPKHVHIFNIDFPIKKCSKRLLECE
jgi:hypothetical protein